MYHPTPLASLTQLLFEPQSYKTSVRLPAAATVNTLLFFDRQPNLTKENIYPYFINNRRISGHQSVVFNLRELDSTEMEDFCQRKAIDSPPLFDEARNFTSNFELRIYSSGCYYLDKYNNWQSDGLWVGPLTDHYRTQCFSTHLTTFASSFLMLPFSIYENQVLYLIKNERDVRENLTQCDQLRVLLIVR